MFIYTVQNISETESSIGVCASHIVNVQYQNESKSNKSYQVSNVT